MPTQPAIFQPCGYALLAGICFLLAGSMASNGQSPELCNNGLDDDLDGRIDCFDPDCLGESECSGGFFGNPVSCVTPPTPNPDFAMALEWGSPDRSANSHSFAVAGDLDQDGVNEIVITNRLENTFSVVDATTGNFDPDILNPDGNAAPVSLTFSPEDAVAIADMQGDGIAEIIVAQDQGNLIERFGIDPVTGILTSDWGGPSQASGNNVGAIGVADFDGDGNAEIYYRDEIMDGEGNVVVEGTPIPWQKHFVFAPLAVDILEDSFCATCQGLELITGNEILAVDVTTGARSVEVDLNEVLNPDGNAPEYLVKYYANWDSQWSSVSVIDYDLDGDMDVFLTGALGTNYTDPPTVLLWDVKEGIVRNFQDPANNYLQGIGRVSLGDVDGDGLQNAVFISNQTMYALDEDLNLLWTKGVSEGISGIAGVSLFDFNADESFEIVYRSESQLQILDGTDGSTLSFMPCLSINQQEYPIVGDLDNDGSTEIGAVCLTSDQTPTSSYSNSAFGQFRLYKAATDTWLSSRSVWNQYSYFSVHVRDDLTIPANLQDHTRIFGTSNCISGEFQNVRPLNRFLSQSTFYTTEGCPAFSSPDLELTEVVSVERSDCPLSAFDVAIRITNRGDMAVAGTLPVTFYRDNPTLSGAERLNTELLTLQSLARGEDFVGTARAEGPGGAFDLFVVINDDGTSPLPLASQQGPLLECDTDNNMGNARADYVPFPLTLDKISDNAKCNASLPDNGHARAYFLGSTQNRVAPIWRENFEDLTDGSMTDTGTTGWTLSGGTGARRRGVFGSQGGRSLLVERSGDTPADAVTWTSEPVDIQQYDLVSLSLTLLASPNLDTSGERQDFVRVSYRLDGGPEVQVLEEFGNFQYLRPKVTDLSGGTLEISVTMHSTEENEIIRLDNVLVRGRSQALERIHDETDNFSYTWYLDDNFNAARFTGSNYSSMPEGMYSVVGFAEDYSCYSDTLRVEIRRTDSQFDLAVTEVSPLTNCQVPDGELLCEVQRTDPDGNVATLIPSEFSFTWFFSSEGISPIGTSERLSDRTADTYKVRVRELATGCFADKNATITTSQIMPPAPQVSVTDVVSCLNLESGSATASIPGDPSPFTFEWFDGPTITLVPDFTGPTYDLILPGTYTVRAIDSSNCISNPAVQQVGAPANYPNPVTTQLQPSDGCRIGNGRARADSDGQGTVAGHSFVWFRGENVLEENRIIPGDPDSVVPTAFYLNDETFQVGGMPTGTYTVRVTHDGSGCASTATIFIEDNSVSPLPVDVGFYDVTPIYGCDPASLGSVDLSRFIQSLTDTDNLQKNENGSFEEPDLAATSAGLSFAGGTIRQLPQSLVNGWSTTATDNRIEIWGENQTAAPYVEGAYEGNQFAEINATQNAALYFDVNTIPGVTMRWTFAHRARAGTDSGEDQVRLLIGPPPPGGGTTGVEGLTEIGVFSSDRTMWHVYEGDYIIPEDQYFTRYAYQAVSTSSGNISIGNFLDGIEFEIAPFVFNVMLTNDMTGVSARMNTEGIFDGLTEGTYSLFVSDSFTGCTSEQIPIQIVRNPDEPSVQISDLVHDRACDAALGTGEFLARAVTNSNSYSREPGDYTFELFMGGTTDPASRVDGPRTIASGFSGHRYTNLADTLYRVKVTNNLSKCSQTTDVVIDDISGPPGSPQCKPRKRFYLPGSYTPRLRQCHDGWRQCRLPFCLARRRQSHRTLDPGCRLLEPVGSGGRKLYARRHPGIHRLRLGPADLYDPQYPHPPRNRHRRDGADYVRPRGDRRGPGWGRAGPRARFCRQADK